jgi:hypothetical protein
MADALLHGAMLMASATIPKKSTALGKTSPLSDATPARILSLSPAPHALAPGPSINITRPVTMSLSRTRSLATLLQTVSAVQRPLTEQLATVMLTATAALVRFLVLFTLQTKNVLMIVQSTNGVASLMAIAVRAVNLVSVTATVMPIRSPLRISLLSTIPLTALSPSQALSSRSAQSQHQSIRSLYPVTVLRRPSTLRRLHSHVTPHQAATIQR